MGITRSPSTGLFHETVQFLLGLVALALLTGLCFWLDFRLVSTAFTFLILIVVLSLAGGFISLVALSFVAVGSLNYFFAHPNFDFRVYYPEDIITVAAFLVTSLIVTGLVARMRAASDEQAKALDTIPVLVWRTSPDGSAEFSNQRYREYTGISSEELSGLGWLNALHTEDRAIEEWRAALAAKKPFQKEGRIRSATGEYRWFALRMTPLRDVKGTILKWYGTASDIEERRQAREALRDSEEQWRAVFENNPTMYFMIDVTGTVLSVNPLGAAQLGYSIGELVGRSVLNVFYESDRAAVQRNAAVCLERLGQPMSWEARKQRKDGTMLWVRETGRAMFIKQQPVILIVCEDVTDRKRTESYLADAQRISRTGSFAYDVAHARLIHSSDEHHRLFGFDPAAGMPAPRDWALRIHPDDRIKAVVDMVQRLREQSDYEVDFRTVHPDGTIKYIHSVSHAVLGPSGDLVEIRGTSTDVTERKQAEEARLEAQNRLAHANRVATMGQLTASIAHEVNQPVGALVTNAHAALRLLRIAPPDLDQARQALADIIKDGQRVSGVITRIRALIKRSPPQEDLLDINDVITETIALTGGEILRSVTSLETELGSGLPPVRGDRVQLQQVIMNLLMNAIEAMSNLDGGTRELRIGTGKDAEDRILLTVRDSGPALTSDDLERFFEAFYSTKPHGMGIGLSICRSIIEAHRGRIWATANVPQGATLHVTLPAARETAA